MPLIFETHLNHEIDFKEFINSAKSKVKFDDIESLLEMKDELLYLGNNKNFFTDYLNNQLKGDIKNFQIDNNYNEQSFLIFDSENFYVRVTYWPILSNNSIIKDFQNKTFSYDMAHDHNFSLLTTGYKGQGYGTKIWQYDYNKVAGYVGEDIDMTFIGETNLSEKKAIFYEPSKDIHLQMPPTAEDSLAINIILKSYKQFEKRQYCFDIENKKIESIIYGTSESKFGILKLASIFGNELSKEILINLSKKHEIPQVRQEAIISLASLENKFENYEIGLNDRDISVRNLCKFHLEQKKNLS
jgi:hypothetical protein